MTRHPATHTSLRGYCFLTFLANVAWISPCSRVAATSPDPTCEAGEFLASFNPHECKDCPEGKYHDSSSHSDMSCKKCPAGTVQSQTKQASCEPCSLGLYQPLIGQTTCVDAPEGKVVGTPGANYPEDCDFGKFQSSTGKSECDNCPTGKYADSTGTVDCKLCDKGTFSDQEGTRYGFEFVSGSHFGCKGCAKGKYQNGEGQASCIKCSKGKYQNHVRSETCINCAEGTYADVTALEDCIACATGTYEDTPGQETCKDCGKGYFVGYAAARDFSECEQCVKGKYGAQRANAACEACEEGTYVNTEGQSECDSCPAGTFEDVKGSQACKMCSKGTFQSQTGQNRCDNCVKGTYQSYAGKNSCINCDAGKYSGVYGGHSCKDCATGEYQNAVAKSECIFCAAGTYENTKGSDKCKECPAGYYGDIAGLHTCKGCVPGTFAGTTNLQACVACPQGTFEDVGKQSVCTKCPAGSANTVTGSAYSYSCVKCQAGKNMPTEGGVSCKSCAAGFISPAGSANCEACSSGKYEYENVCVECPKGTFQDSSGKIACADCGSVAFYCDVPGMDAHKSVPAGSYPCGVTANSQKQEKICLCDGGRYCLGGQDTYGDANKACPRGYFQDNRGQSLCLPCSDQTFQDSEESVDCKDVQPGYYTKSDSSEATKGGAQDGFQGTASFPAYVEQLPCPVGYRCLGGSSGASGPPGIQLCPVGKYQDETAQSACKEVGEKYFQDQEGQGSRTPVTSGSYGIGGTDTTHENQEPCETGKYCLGEEHPNQNCLPPSYQDQVGQNACKVCDKDYQSSALDEIYTSLGVSPKKGGYQDQHGQGQCKHIAPGMYGCEDFKAVCECPKGNYCPGGSSNYTSCEAGKFADQKNMSTCSPCPTTQYQDEQTQTACKDIPPGYVYNSAGPPYEAIRICQKGHMCPGGSAPEQKCVAGKYADSEGMHACLDCGHARISAKTEASESCTDIPAGQYGCLSTAGGVVDTSTTQSVKCDCKSGHSCAGGASDPVPCPKGSRSDTPTGSSVCVACLGRDYQDDEGKTACKVAGPGYYGFAGTCSAEGFSPPTLANHSIRCECPIGTFCEEASNYPRNCSEGHFQDERAKPTCKQCGVLKVNGIGNAFFQNETGSGTCHPIAEGYYGCENEGDSTTTAYKKACICEKGTFCAGLHHANVDCEVGHFASTEGMSLCDKCSMGRFQALEGQSLCNNCPNNQFQNETGQANCENIRPGYHGCAKDHSVKRGSGEMIWPLVQNPETGPTQECECDVGEFCIGGEFAPAPCQPGHYQPNKGQNKCLPCPSNEYQPEKKQIACMTIVPGEYGCKVGSAPAPLDASLYSSAAASPPNSCDSCGQASKCKDGQCHSYFVETAFSHACTCEKGYQCAGGSEPKKMCEAGFYQGGEGGSTCTACANGQYQDEEGKSSCDPVPSGSYGGRKNGTECVWADSAVEGGDAWNSICGCMPGTACIGARYDQQVCREGTFQALERQSFCLACPTGKFQPSTKSSSCVDNTPCSGNESYIKIEGNFTHDLTCANCDTTTNQVRNPLFIAGSSLDPCIDDPTVVGASQSSESVESSQVAGIIVGAICFVIIIAIIIKRRRDKHVSEDEISAYLVQMQSSNKTVFRDEIESEVDGGSVEAGKDNSSSSKKKDVNLGYEPEPGSGPEALRKEEQTLLEEKRAVLRNQAEERRRLMAKIEELDRSSVKTHPMEQESPNEPEENQVQHEMENKEMLDHVAHHQGDIGVLLALKAKTTAKDIYYEELGNIEAGTQDFGDVESSDDDSIFDRALDVDAIGNDIDKGEWDFMVHSAQDAEGVDNHLDPEWHMDGN